MKILALEKEVAGSPREELALQLKAEAMRVWTLQQEDVIREAYFRQDRHEAVLVLECVDADEAQRKLNSLPLVQAGLVTFEIIPLIPYDGFARLFSS